MDRAVNGLARSSKRLLVVSQLVNASSPSLTRFRRHTVHNTQGGPEVNAVLEFNNILF